MSGARGARHAATVVVVAFGMLFYLQFGLQALAHHGLQGALTLVGAAALLGGTVRRARRQPAATVVLIGTLPILLLHVAMTIEDAAELPFLVGSIPVPFVAVVCVARSTTARSSPTSPFPAGSTAR